MKTRTAEDDRAYNQRVDMLLAEGGYPNAVDIATGTIIREVPQDVVWRASWLADPGPGGGLCLSCYAAVDRAPWDEFHVARERCLASDRPLVLNCGVER